MDEGKILILMINISASIVIYNEKEEILKRVIEDFLSIKLKKELIVVDNSPQNSLEKFCQQFDGVKYIFNNHNLGFGRAHNLAFTNLTHSSDLHLILNPDIYFDGDAIKNFLLWMQKAEDTVLAVPEVLSPDSSRQYTVRKIPTPLTLIKRRLNIKGMFNEFIKKDEFRDVNFTQVSEIPFAHGCFFAFKTEIFKKLNGFDEDYFMYMEDVDIFLRAKKYGKTVLNPNYMIFHEHRRGSAKNITLLLHHISSASKFFKKHKTINQ